eukprot:scaffold21875_cov87-Skeletonema_dohrnii-CCMP3373.AAC.1
MHIESALDIWYLPIDSTYLSHSSHNTIAPLCRIRYPQAIVAALIFVIALFLIVQEVHSINRFVELDRSHLTASIRRNPLSYPTSITGVPVRHRPRLISLKAGVSSGHAPSFKSPVSSFISAVCDAVVKIPIPHADPARDICENLLSPRTLESTYSSIRLSFVKPTVTSCILLHMLYWCIANCSFIPFSHPFRPASLVLSYSNFYIDYPGRGISSSALAQAVQSVDHRSYAVAITSTWLPCQVLHSIDDDVNLKASCRSLAISLDELEHLCSTLFISPAVPRAHPIHSKSMLSIYLTYLTLTGCLHSSEEYVSPPFCKGPQQHSFDNTSFDNLMAFLAPVRLW